RGLRAAAEAGVGRRGGHAEDVLVAGRVEAAVPGDGERGLAGRGGPGGLALGGGGGRGRGRSCRGLETAGEPLLGEEVGGGVVVGAAVVAAVEPDHVHRGAVPLDGAVVGVGLVQAEERVVLALDQQRGHVQAARHAGRAVPGQQLDRGGGGLAGGGDLTVDG